MIECLLCGLYFAAGLSAHHQIAPATDKGMVYWDYDINYTRNPYGIASIGYSFVDTKKWNMSLELRHESSLATNNDHGLTEAALMVTWHPFK